MDGLNERKPMLLRREVGLGGSVLLGLGSILGTGVFVSIGLAAGVAGPSVIAAIVLAGAVAACNALSSAQLAANHPVSGGTYEYGYRYLWPWLGFMAGWTFLLAKTASAATAALGFAGYTLSALGLGSGGWRVPLAILAVVGLTLVVLGGLRRSSMVNAVVVTVTVLALVAFVLSGLGTVKASGGANLHAIVPGLEGVRGLLEAGALMFVAYTGYGRIATLGEEVTDPRATIPAAIAMTLVATLLLYLGVAIVGVGSVGATAFSASTRATAAPLTVVARTFQLPGVPGLVALGAVTAMLGVLLNLILGLSRVVLAMARRGDLPALFARIDSAGLTPTPAVLLVGLAIGGLALTGDIELAWSFSAFTVLVYYAITNLAALRLSDEQRLYPRWIAVVGLVGCVGLAAFVQPEIALAGIGILVLGLGARGISRRWR